MKESKLTYFWTFNEQSHATFLRQERFFLIPNNNRDKNGLIFNVELFICKRFFLSSHLSLQKWSWKWICIIEKNILYFQSFNSFPFYLADGFKRLHLIQRLDVSQPDLLKWRLLNSTVLLFPFLFLELHITKVCIDTHTDPCTSVFIRNLKDYIYSISPTTNISETCLPQPLTLTDYL